MIKVLSYQQILTYILESVMISGPERQSKIPLKFIWRSGNFNSFTVSEFLNFLYMD